jgi:hypothetical protein
LSHPPCHRPRFQFFCSFDDFLGSYQGMKRLVCWRCLALKGL